MVGWQSVGVHSMYRPACIALHRFSLARGHLLRLSLAPVSRDSCTAERNLGTSVALPL